MDVTLNSDLVKKLRRHRGWSQEQLAHAAGLSERTTQRKESVGGN
jgi:DNA-binding XRE family transcriptional regulator